MTREVDADKRATLRRFAALGAATPLAAGGRARAAADGDDDSAARDAIRGYLATTPGAHFSKLRDDLSLATGETQHHLKRLESAGEVISQKDGDYRRYFPAGRFSAFERRALGYLRRETPRGMVLGLLREPDASGADLARALDVSRPTVSTYAGELAEAGLLDTEEGYRVARPEAVIALVVRYADSFGADAVAFADDAASYISYDG
ncbi:winged helix-turn-helix transcriptional regulator [Halobaculum roseum]|uniref:Winged helix-turn-helix transcriptional regulator n=1 Tax=Halobaculum roseum TaxID=2175149 RepID=A0ABD5MIC9_9EURY|nr:MarR family transcriptional regulator [Halobaculum roseum]QZY02330.1 MarR family transcriptional regulator [Halobaculum roseum]